MRQMKPMRDADDPTLSGAAAPSEGLTAPPNGWHKPSLEDVVTPSPHPAMPAPKAIDASRHGPDCCHPTFENNTAINAALLRGARSLGITRDYNAGAFSEDTPPDAHEVEKIVEHIPIQYFPLAKRLWDEITRLQVLVRDLSERLARAERERDEAHAMLVVRAQWLAVAQSRCARLEAEKAEAERRAEWYKAETARVFGALTHEESATDLILRVTNRVIGWRPKGQEHPPGSAYLSQPASRPQEQENPNGN